MISVRPVEPKDAPDWLSMRRILWPEGFDEHSWEIDQFFAGRWREPSAVLLAEDSAGRAIGLAELSIRTCAEGCRTNRVAYLEGWFVVPEARRQGVGRALVGAAETWARSQGCTEFASDTQPTNTGSSAAHRALGFIEVGAVLCYRKEL